MGASEEWRTTPSKKRTLGQHTPEVLSVDKLGDVCSVLELNGWAKIRVQICSAAEGTVDQKDVARAFNMRKTVTSKKGI